MVFTLVKSAPFLEGPRNRFKELLFTFKVQYNFIGLFENSIPSDLWPVFQ